VIKNIWQNGNAIDHWALKASSIILMVADLLISQGWKPTKTRDGAKFWWKYHDFGAAILGPILIQYSADSVKQSFKSQPVCLDSPKHTNHKTQSYNSSSTGWANKNRTLCYQAKNRL